MPFIELVDYEKAEQDLKKIYDHLIATRGKLANIHMAQSLHPSTIMLHMNLYMEIMYGRSPLKRVDREMIGTVVSIYNNCLYCTEHHAEAVNHFWKDVERINRLKRDYHDCELTQAQIALCNYAANLTLEPGKAVEEKWVPQLKTFGFKDREILDATLIIAYFNFVNRIVMGLGLELEEEGVQGYEFD